MVKTIRLFLWVILSTTLVSCRGFSVSAQRQITSTPLPLATATPLPTAFSILPTQVNNSACTLATQSDGWDCLNQSYGFSIHFPSTAEVARVMPGGGVEVWLQNSPSNPSIDRLLSINIEQSAEWCFPPEAEKVQIGGHEFAVNNGFEPSGVVYAWKSYAIAKEPKKVCFDFIVGFREWAQDDPLFPPEKDQGLEEIESILATFHWLNP